MPMQRWAAKFSIVLGETKPLSTRAERRNANRRSRPRCGGTHHGVRVTAGCATKIFRRRGIVGAHYAMAIVGGLKEPCRSVFLLLSALWLSSVIVSHAASEESSFVVSRHVGEASVSLVGRGSAPCDSAAEIRREGYLKERVASADGSIAMATGPCIRQTTMSCPVKCFRADPVCGTDTVTYWCGAADANCAGVEVAHDGYCNLWESDTNIGSTTAVQSLQLVHMLWLVVAGIFVVLGLL